MALFDPVHHRLEHFALALARNGEAARDIVGETVLIAYERFDSLRHPEAFLSFLFTIARRVYQQRARVGARTEPLEEAHWERLADPRLAPDIGADIRAVYEALDRLPEAQREAVTLFEILGLSLKEIREIQGGTLVAVKVRISRGRKRLARILGVEERAAGAGSAPRGRPAEAPGSLLHEATDRRPIEPMNLYTVIEEL